MESSGASLQQLNSRLPLLATLAPLEDGDRWQEATIVSDDFRADGTCTTEGSTAFYRRRPGKGAHRGWLHAMRGQDM